MKKTISITTYLFFLFTSNVIVEASGGIVNPVLPGNIGKVDSNTAANTASGAASAVAIILARFFSAALALGSVIMLIYFVLSAYKWLTAGDSNTVSQARQGIMNAVLGMVVLASIFAIANLVAPLLGLQEGACKFPQQICWPTF